MESSKVCLIEVEGFSERTSRTGPENWIVVREKSKEHAKEERRCLGVVSNIPMGWRKLLTA